MATEPKSYELEPLTQFNAHEKNYIKALIKEAVAAIPQPHTASSCSCGGRIDGLVTRMNSLESRYTEDDKYTLTRAKLVRLMKEEGIE